MKQLLFLITLFGVSCSIVAQTEENLFEWGTGNSIVVKDKFLGLYSEEGFGDIPLYTYKEYDVSSDNGDSYRLKLMGANTEMPIHGNYDLYEICYKNKTILRHYPHDLLYDTRFISVDKSTDYFIKVPLSDDSFALFFGGWLFGSGDEATEMVVVVVSGGRAKVVFEDYAYAYQYTPGDNFSLEFIDDINGLYDIDSIGFSESYMKVRTKYKIWKEGNMLKYKSWK